ncbi:MAG: serine/threonine-protein phosphatase [Bacteroidales bacterium]|nr:serine/threonine-protein phosphatase [Bacteroidales bacterium]MBE6343042.1 serine/threonine-protein phosphatase [Lentimicrobiaceae bacterium]
MKTNYITFSEAGKRRANQDVYRVIEFPEYDRVLMVVCDGMGGHAMGDVAAETVCNAICEFWKQNIQVSDSESKIIEACKVASDALYARSRVVRPIEMGTTLVFASLEGNTVTIAHCGDSRCYLLRDGEVVYQTQDHADPHWGSEVVTRCFFSMNPEVAVPDIARFEVKSGDSIFLCSDGVYKAMAPQILTARLQDDKPLDDVIDVIKFMCEKFSTDNYTGVLAKVL